MQATLPDFVKVSVPSELHLIVIINKPAECPQQPPWCFDLDVDRILVQICQLLKKLQSRQIIMRS